MAAPNLVEIFLTESEDLLAQLEQGLMALEERPDDPEVVNSLFRSAHTIKGGAGLTGLSAIVDFTHVLETVLDRLRDGLIHVNHPFISCLLEASDILQAMVGAVAAGGAPEEVPGRDESVQALTRYMGLDGSEAESGAAGTEPPSEERPRTYRIRIALDEDILETGQDPILLLDELRELGELGDLRVDASRLPELVDLDPCKLYLSWSAVLTTTAPRSTVDNVFLFVADDNEIEIEEVEAPAGPGADPADAGKRLGEILVEEGHVSATELDDALAKQRRLGEILVEEGRVEPRVVQRVVKRQKAARAIKRQSSIRVNTDKLDRLVNLVGELVISVAQVNRTLETLDSDGEEARSAMEGLDQISRELQEQVMTVRMVPVEEMFLRYKRVVRDLADGLGKSARLETSGTETELDKNVIEVLADPLKHLVRNCVDHGLESPAQRAQARKPEEGTVWLRAAQQEGSIVIEVTDDGAGIDRERVLAKARNRGLVEEERELTDAEVYELLFEPGFSTASAVTDLSGRGVGLDVVRRNITELRGTLEVESEPGRGTCFRIRLPLTLAIIEGMVVQVGSETLTVPLLSIIEQLRPLPGQVKQVQGKGEVVNVRGELLPMVRLHRLFGFETDRTDPTKALVLVLESYGRKLGLLVDDVLGQEQAVIKSLDENYRKVDGVAGATILGDGRVSLILDVRGVERMALGA